MDEPFHDEVPVPLIRREVDPVVIADPPPDFGPDGQIYTFGGGGEAAVDSSIDSGALFLLTTAAVLLFFINRK